MAGLPINPQFAIRNPRSPKSMAEASLFRPASSTCMSTCANPVLLTRKRLHQAREQQRWAGEESVGMRNMLLAELCDNHIHCQHISTAGSVRLIRQAPARGVKISGEVCPHRIALTDGSIQNFDAKGKMNPPLRTQRDIDA